MPHYVITFTPSPPAYTRVPQPCPLSQFVVHRANSVTTSVHSMYQQLTHAPLPRSASSFRYTQFVVHRVNNVTIDNDPSLSMWGNARVELVAWAGTGEGPLTLQPYQLVVQPQGAWTGWCGLPYAQQQLVQCWFCGSQEWCVLFADLDRLPSPCY